MRDRVTGVAALAVGVIAIVAAQYVAPVRTPPLYDGVVVQEPYRWLQPPPGQAGGPTSAAGAAEPVNGSNPLIALATGEQPPQAQIFATPGSLGLPAGTTLIKMSIRPVAPATLPTDGHIDGNVYRISVTNQAGVDLTAPASQKVTVVMRSPGDDANVTMMQRTSVGWRSLETKGAGFGSAYLAIVTGFGDFALVAPGPIGAPAPGGANASAGPGSTAANGPPAVPSANGTAGGQGGISSAVVAVFIALVLLGMLIAVDVRRRLRRPGRSGPGRRR